MAKAKQKAKEKPTQTITIVGFVEEYDSDDDTVGIMISTEDTGDYIVKLDRKGKELLDYVDEEVELTGAVSENSDGEQIITVKHFDLLDYDDNDDNYDDDYSDDDDFNQDRRISDYDD